MRTASLMLTLMMAAVLMSASAEAAPVALQNGTATFSQAGACGGDCTPAQAIDGIRATTNNTSNGWAIMESNGQTNPQTAVWETVNDVFPSPGGGTLFVRLEHASPAGLAISFPLGKFRFSATTDDRATFADGLATGGDVDATWTVLHPAIARSADPGTTMTINPDGSILVGGTLPAEEIYTIVLPTTLTNITGLRLEALADASLPTGGPGRRSSGGANGNILLTELLVADSVEDTRLTGVVVHSAASTHVWSTFSGVRAFLKDGATFVNPNGEQLDIDFNTPGVYEFGLRLNRGSQNRSTDGFALRLLFNDSRVPGIIARVDRDQTGGTPDFYGEVSHVSGANVVTVTGLRISSFENIDEVGDKAAIPDGSLDYHGHFQVTVSNAEVTTQSSTNATNVAPGTAVSDTATVADVLGDDPVPTGMVTFFLCEPSEMHEKGLGGCFFEPPPVSWTPTLRVLNPKEKGVWDAEDEVTVQPGVPGPDHRVGSVGEEAVGSGQGVRAVVVDDHGLGEAGGSGFRE